MDRKELQQRTKKFHVDVIKFCSDFPKNAAGFEIAKQLIRLQEVLVQTIEQQ